VGSAVLNALTIDADDAENRYRFEPADVMTPECIFDRTWAMTLLDHVLDFLEQEYTANVRADVFDRLKVVLTQGKGALPGAELAAQLGTSEGVVHSVVHRLKKRYRKILQNEIAATLDDPSAVDEEIRWLFEAVRS
jgi:RNA polymerase sigma-70 factor (ECF subfamily)